MWFQIAMKYSTRGEEAESLAQFVGYVKALVHREGLTPFYNCVEILEIGSHVDGIML